MATTTVEREFKAKVRNDAGVLVGMIYDEEVARLLDAAPEMVAAAAGILAWYSALPEPGLVPDSVTLCARLREIRAALAKAEG